MKQTHKRMLSLLLVVCMLLSVMVPAVFAEGDQLVYSFANSGEVGSSAIGHTSVTISKTKAGDAALFGEGNADTWQYMARAVNTYARVNVYSQKADGTTNGIKFGTDSGITGAGAWFAIKLNKVPDAIYSMAFKSDNKAVTATDVYVMSASDFTASAVYGLYASTEDADTAYAGTSFPTDANGKTTIELMDALLASDKAAKVGTYELAAAGTDTFENITLAGDANDAYVLVFKDATADAMSMFLSSLTLTKTGDVVDESPKEYNYTFNNSQGSGSVGHTSTTISKTKGDDAALFGEGSPETWQYMARSVNSYARAIVYALKNDGVTTNGIKFMTEGAAAGAGSWFAIKLNNLYPAIYSMAFKSDYKAVTATDIYVMPASDFVDSAAYKLYEKLEDTAAYAGLDFPKDSSGKTIIELMDTLLASDKAEKVGTYQLDAAGTDTFENIEINGDAGDDYVLIFKEATAENMSMFLSSLTLTKTGTVTPSGGAGSGNEDDKDEDDKDEDDKLNINTILQSIVLSDSSLAEFEVGNNDFIATSVVNGHNYLYVPHNMAFFVYDLDTWEKVDEQRIGWQETDGIFVDSKGIVWVYGQNSSLYRYNPLTKELKRSSLTAESLDGFKASVLSDPFELDGKLYFATWGEARIVSYDPATDKFATVVDLTNVEGKYQGAVKANAMVYKDGYIYVSVHAAAVTQAPHHIVKYDLKANKVVDTFDMGIRDNGLAFGPYLTGMRIVGDVLLGCATNQNQMIAVDINTMELVDVGFKGGIIHSMTEVIKEADGNEKVYFFARPFEQEHGSERYLCEYNSSTGKVTKVEGFEQATTYQLNTRQSAFVTVEKEGLTGESLFLMQKDGTVVLFNLASKKTVVLTGLTYGDGVGVNLLEFKGGPAGSNEIYLGGFMLNQVGIYDYVKNEMTAIHKGYSEQIETIERVGDKLYVSGYGACSIIEMDPKTGEYKLLFALNEEHKLNLVQERIQNITVGDNKVFGTTVPHKGITGGFIVWYDYEKEATFVVVEEDKVIYLKDSDKSTWYDVKTNEKVVFNTADQGANDFKGAIADQGVNAIHYYDGFLYGVTMVHKADTEDRSTDANAVMFAYDVENLEMITYDLTEAIDGLKLPVDMISSFHPDPEVEGKFWGVVAQTLFTATYDKENKTFHVEEVISFGKDSYRYYGNEFENGAMCFKDGYLLVNIRSKNPTPGSYAYNDLRFICLDDPEYNFTLYTSQCTRYVLGDDDNIYISFAEQIQKLESAEIIKTIKTMKVNADAVQAQIDAIGTVTLESKAAVAAVRDAYDKLTDNEKKLVEEERLIAAEAAIAALEQATDADKAAADAVQKQIDAIGTVTLESEAAIAAARTAYNALTDLQKAMVRGDLLVAAETALADLKAAAEQAVTDKAAADAVQALVDAIGTEVTLESETAIAAARAAYDALTVAQKKLVDATALKAAEAKLADLKEAAADQAAADAVQALIDAIGKVTKESGAAITAARTAYDALTNAQKELVNVAALEAAEAAYAALSNPQTGDTMPVGLVMAMVLVSAMAMTVMLVPDIRKKFVR